MGGSLRSCRCGDRAVGGERQRAVREGFLREIAELVQRTSLRVWLRAARANLHRRREVGIDEAAVVREPRDQHARSAADAVHADAVIRREVAQAVGDEPIAIQLDGAHHVRPVTDDQIGAGIDDGAGEFDDVAAILTRIVLASERQLRSAIAFGAAVERHDDDVVLRGELD